MGQHESIKLTLYVKIQCPGICAREFNEMLAWRPLMCVCNMHDLYHRCGIQLNSEALHFSYVA